MMAIKKFKRYSFISFLFGSALFVFSNCATLRPSTPPSFQFQLSSKTVVNGGLLVVTVQAPAGTDPTTLSAHFGETKLSFFDAPELGKDFYQSFLGLSLPTKPGQAVLEIRYLENEKTKTTFLNFEVIDGHYRSEVLHVQAKHVKLRTKDLKRVQRENAEIGKLYQKISLEKRWNGPFIFPISSEVTSPYGTRRVFNGELQSYHAGLDLKAAEGTPILASANGKVVLAKDLFLSGKTVILEHGFGVFTSYAHLSVLQVKRGDWVQSKGILGLSGKSGRASGPHLHWGVIIQRTKINPIEMTTLGK